MFTLTYKIIHLIFEESSFKFWFKKRKNQKIQLSITSQIHRPISELYWTQYCTKEDCSREIWSGTKRGEDGRRHGMEGEIHTEAGGELLEEACGEAMLKHFCFPEGLHPMGESPCQSRGIVSRKELWRGTVLDWSQLPLVSTPAALGGGVGISGEGAQCSWPREGSKGIVLFVFAHHNLSLIDSKLHLFPSVESVLLAVVVVYQSPCLYQHLCWNLALSLGWISFAEVGYWRKGGSALFPAQTATLASGFPGLFLSNSSLINSRCVDPRYWKTRLWLGCIPIVFESNGLNLSHFTLMSTTFRRCFALKF